MWLKPYMRQERHAAGQFLFRKGDPADALYLLVEGQLEFVEIEKRQSVGEIFGEVAFFAPDRRRTLTASCVSAFEVLSISGAPFRQLYFKSGNFAFTVANLIGERMGSDIQRLQARVQHLEDQMQQSPRGAWDVYQPLSDEAA